MLSASDPTLPPGEPPRPVCQRCGRSVDKDAIGTQVGLCHCMICEVYACRWCWADADGTCPSCGVRYAPAALLAVGPAADPGVATAVVTGRRSWRRRWRRRRPARSWRAQAGSSTLGRRPDIRAPLAIGTLVVALALLGLAFGGPLGSTAGSTRSDADPGRRGGRQRRIGRHGLTVGGAVRRCDRVPEAELGADIDRPRDAGRHGDDRRRQPGTAPATATATPAGRSGPTPPPTATPAPTPVPTPTRRRPGRRPRPPRRRAARWCRSSSDRPSQRRAPPGPRPGSRARSNR